MAFFYKYEYTNKRKNIHPCWLTSKILWEVIFQSSRCGPYADIAQCNESCNKRSHES